LVITDPCWKTLDWPLFNAVMAVPEADPYDEISEGLRPPVEIK